MLINLQRAKGWGRGLGRVEREGWVRVVCSFLVGPFFLNGRRGEAGVLAHLERISLFFAHEGISRLR